MIGLSASVRDKKMVQLIPSIVPNEISSRQGRPRHNNSNVITRYNVSQDVRWSEQTYDHMTEEMSDDEETVRSNEEEEENKVSDNNVDEGTICSEDEEEEIDDDMCEYDGDIENVSEGADTQSVSEHDEEDEDEESEKDGEEIETINVLSKEIIFRVKGFKANFAFEILQELIDECILDVVFEMHRQAKLCQQTCRNRDSNDLSYLFNEQGYDIFGQNISTLKLQAGKQRCLNCNAMFPVTTYVKHFSKCLGLVRGRTATRNVCYIDDERTDKFSVFDFPEVSPSLSSMSNEEMNTDTQETCVTSSRNAYMFSGKRRVIKNTYAKRRTMKQIQDKS